MGVGAENGKVESWDLYKSKGGRKKKKKVEEAEEDEEETGCWVRLRFIGSCISSRSKVDSSISGTSTHYGNFLSFLFYFSLSKVMFFHGLFFVYGSTSCVSCLIFSKTIALEFYSVSVLALVL